MINDFFNILLPQACLIVFIIFQLIMGMFFSDKKSEVARIISAIGITASIFLLTTVQTEPQYFALNNSIVSDSYTQLFHFVILLSGFLIVLFTKRLVMMLRDHAFTFHGLFLTALLGAMSIVSANDFLTLFVSIELLSFSIYFLIASTKGYYSKEASFKYLITTAISTAVFLFGVSYLYGLTGTFNFSEIYEIVSEQQGSLVYSFASIMTVLGLVAKLAIFPFANWVIDVYKGTESSVLAFLSTIPKLALFGILCRLLVFPLSNSFELTFVIALVALITAFWANTYAIRENNIKAILACSTAANASYMFLTAGLVSVYNLSTVVFYLICYVLMNIAVFAFLNIIEMNKISMQTQSLSGVFAKNPIISLGFVFAVIGLAGFPITSGFVAKIYLFSAIAHSGLIFIPVLLILLLLTVLALFYYLKLINPIFLSEVPSQKLKLDFSQGFVLAITVFATLLIGVYPEKLIELCKFIAYNI